MFSFILLAVLNWILLKGWENQREAWAMTKKTKGIFKTKQKNILAIVKVIGVCVPFTLFSLLFFQKACELGLSCKELGDFLAVHCCCKIICNRIWLEWCRTCRCLNLYGRKGCNLHLYSKNFSLSEYPELFCVSIAQIFEYLLSFLNTNSSKNSCVVSLPLSFL